MVNPNLLTTTQAAEALGVSLSTVYRMVDKGILTPSKTQGGHRRFDRLQIEDFLNKSDQIEAPQNPSRNKINTVADTAPEETEKKHQARESRFDYSHELELIPKIKNGLPAWRRAPVAVIRVQQVVSFVAVGFAQEFVVKADDIGILVALAQRSIGIHGVDALNALFSSGKVGVVQPRRAAAVNAAARTRHDFDEVKVTRPRLDVLRYFFGVS